MDTSSHRGPPRIWIYGSDPRCDFVLKAAGIATRHCLLCQHADGFVIEDLGSESGTWVNSERLPPHQPLWVTTSDLIVIGDSVHMEWPGPLPLPPPHNPSITPVATRALGRRPIRIGRTPDNDIVLDYPMISRNHARLTNASGGRLILEDLDSVNGTAVSNPANRIKRTEVTAKDNVFFGSFKIRVSRMLESEKLVLGSAVAGTFEMSREVVIGRDPKCGFPIDSPIVSFHHARLLRTPRGIEVEDLGSRNGTFVDGARIDGRVVLTPGSEVALGNIRLRLVDAAGTLERRDSAANVTIEAEGITVEVLQRGKRQRLLDPISLTVFPSELVALMGLAGAGKTTMMRALNGYTRPTSGRVLFNGEDLYANQDQFRLQVGYVPQDDILYPQLTVREALFYTAKLRTDLTNPEIDERIKTVLTDLGIEDIGGRLIGSPERKVISGGQRKRVNIAMELLSDPSVLFLDEPTSGLSSYDASQVIGVLRRMADGGKTVVCTIHQPSIDVFRQFDSLIVVARDKGDNPGLLAFFGPAYPESIEFFTSLRSSDAKTDATTGRGTPEQLTSGLAAFPASEWAAIYRNSNFHHEFVESRAGRVTKSGKPQTASKRRVVGIDQFVVLLRRNFLLKVRDRVQMLILVAQAPLFAVLVGIVFGSLTRQPQTDPAKWIGRLSSTHFLAAVAAVWFGFNNAAREIVGETAIFRRERMVNLRLPSYVFSKLCTLGLVCLLQCLAMLGIIYAACGLKAPFDVVLGIMLTASLTGTSIGLLISAIAPTTEAAIAFLPVVLLPFILLAGGIRPLNEMPAVARWIATICPTRWAYEASFLQEAGQRPKLAVAAAPSSAIAAPDVAEAAFPVREGRSSLQQSLAALGITLGICLILVLSILTFRGG